MLSDGSWPCGTSTSLLVSPVVELVDAAGVEPKSAMLFGYWEGRSWKKWSNPVVVSFARELVVVVAVLKAHRFLYAPVRQVRAQSKRKDAGVKRSRAGCKKCLRAPLYAPSPTCLKSKKFRASQAPLQAPGPAPPSAAFGSTFHRPAGAPDNFPRPPIVPLQRSSLKESQRSTHTECLRASLPVHALGESPRTSVFTTALSATNRHRSAASHYSRHRFALYPPALFSFAFSRLRVEGLAPGR
jgi:hypothetical protein